MSVEEEIKYKVSLDTSELQTQILGINANIANTLQNIVQPIQTSVQASAALGAGAVRLYSDIGGQVRPYVDPSAPPISAITAPGNITYAPSFAEAAAATLGMPMPMQNLGAIEQSYLAPQAMADKAIQVVAAGAAGTVYGLGSVGGGIAGGLIGTALGGPLAPVTGILGAAVGSYVGGEAGDFVNKVALGDISFSMEAEASIGAMSNRILGAPFAEPYQRFAVGGGMSPGQLRDVSSMIRDIDVEKVGMSNRDILGIIQGGAQIGAFGQTSDMDEFKSTVRELVEGVREVSLAFRQSYQESIQSIGNMRQMGMFDVSQYGEQAAFTSAVAGMARVSPDEAQMYGIQGGAMALQAGLSAQPAAMNAQINLASIEYARQTGALTSEQIQRGGGVSGILANTQAATNAFITSDYGTAIMGAGFTPGESRLNLGAVQDMGINEMVGAAARNLDTIEKQVEFQYRQQREFGPQMQEQNETMMMLQAVKMAQMLPGMNTPELMKMATANIANSQFGMSTSSVDAFFAKMDTGSMDSLQESLRLEQQRVQMNKYMEEYGPMADINRGLSWLKSLPAEAFDKGIRGPISDFSEDMGRRWMSAVHGIRVEERDPIYNPVMADEEGRAAMIERLPETLDNYRSNDTKIGRIEDQGRLGDIARLLPIRQAGYIGGALRGNLAPYQSSITSYVLGKAEEVFQRGADLLEDRIPATETYIGRIGSTREEVALKGFMRSYGLDENDTIQELREANKEFIIDMSVLRDQIDRGVEIVSGAERAGGYETTAAGRAEVSRISRSDEFQNVIGDIRRSGSGTAISTVEQNRIAEAVTGNRNATFAGLSRNEIRVATAAIDRQGEMRGRAFVGLSDDMEKLIGRSEEGGLAGMEARLEARYKKLDDDFEDVEITGTGKDRRFSFGGAGGKIGNLSEEQMYGISKIALDTSTNTENFARRLKSGGIGLDDAQVDQARGKGVGYFRNASGQFQDTRETLISDEFVNERAVEGIKSYYGLTGDLDSRTIARAMDVKGGEDYKYQGFLDLAEKSSSLDEFKETSRAFGVGDSSLFQMIDSMAAKRDSAGNPVDISSEIADIARSAIDMRAGQIATKTGSAVGGGVSADGPGQDVLDETIRSYIAVQRDAILEIAQGIAQGR